MKRLLSAFLAAILVFLGGCKEEKPEPPTPEPEPPEENVDYAPHSEEEFLEGVAFDPYWEELALNEPREMVDVGKDLCWRVENGTSFLTLSQHLEDQTGDPMSADHVLEASVYVFCPEYIDQFEAYRSTHRG